MGSPLYNRLITFFIPSISNLLETSSFAVISSSSPLCLEIQDFR